MMTSHEWPQQPPSASFTRTKLTHESLAALYWSKPCRYDSYSDGDDELQTREPLESASCLSSGDQDGQSFQISCQADHCKTSGDAEVKEMQRPAGYGNHTGYLGYSVQSSGYGDRKGADTVSQSPKIGSSYNEAKAKVSANIRVDLIPIVALQPLRLNPRPISDPLKLAGKHTARTSIQTHVIDEGKESGEPSSPEVTCLGRVRIKERHCEDEEHARIEDKSAGDVQKKQYSQESKKQPVDKDHKDRTRKGSRNRGLPEKKCCFPTLKRKEDRELGSMKLFGSSASSVVPLEVAETRREKAAILARTLTSLLEDLRRLDAENLGYVPVVPPPNSLLLMRGVGKSCNQEVSMFIDESVCQPDNNHRIVNDMAWKDRSAKEVPFRDVKMQKILNRSSRVDVLDTGAQTRVSMAQEVLSLAEIKSNSVVQNGSSSERSDKQSVGTCAQELALWQRRSIGKLAIIDTSRRPMRMAVKQPKTK